MARFEVILNGERSGIIVEAMHDVKAKAECRKRGYRCFSLINLNEESREGKAEYDAVEEYLCNVSARAEILREIDADFGIDPMMTLATADDATMQRVEEPDAETIRKANEYAKEWDLPFRWSREAERLHLYTLRY